MLRLNHEPQGNGFTDWVLGIKMWKNVFVDGHKRSDVMEDYKRFLNKMKELKSYLVEFDQNGKMKNKTYSSDCAVGAEDRWLVIVITYNECTFSANDGICKAWTRIEDTFLYPKGWGQKIMVSGFLLSFSHLNPFSLSNEK